MTQKGKVHARNAQPKHAYMYTRHNDYKNARQHIAPKNTAHFHCNCMSQKNYRKYYVPQGIKTRNKARLVAKGYN